MAGGGGGREPLAHEGLTGLTGVRLWGLLPPIAGRVRLWGPWGLCPHAKQLPPTAERVANEPHSLIGRELLGPTSSSNATGIWCLP